MIKAAQLFQTYIWLVDTIRRCQPVSFEEINRRWMLTAMSGGEPFNARTFRRARNAIEEMFDINIHCSLGANGMYRIHDESMRGNSVKQWMLSTLSVTGAVRDAHKMQDRILLESVPSGDQMLTEVTRAMQNGHTLRICYQKFIDSEPYEAELEPYCLKLFHQRWYLLSHRVDRDYLAIYSLDRMQRADETANPFELPKGFDPKEFFGNMFGVFQPAKDEKPVNLILRTYKGEWNYLRTLPMHHSQTEVDRGRTRDGEEYVDFRFRLFPTHDLKFELLSRIANIEILEPVELRHEICDMLVRAAERNG